MSTQEQKPTLKRLVQCMWTMARVAKDVYKNTKTQYRYDLAKQQAEAKAGKQLVDFLEEEKILTPEEILKSSGESEIVNQLRDIIEGGKAPDLTEAKLTANANLAASKVFILVTVNDKGDISYHVNFKEGSAVDLAGSQVACAQLADELYDYVTRLSSGGDAPQMGLDDFDNYMDDMDEE